MRPRVLALAALLALPGILGTDACSSQSSVLSSQWIRLRRPAATSQQSSLRIGRRELTHARFFSFPATVTVSDADYAAGWKRGADESARLRRTFSIAPGTPVLVNASVGEITINGWDRPELVVEITRHAPSAAGLSKLGADIDNDPAGLRVSSLQADEGLDPALRALITISAPFATVFESVHLVEGKMTIANLQGAITADIRRGSIEAAGLGGRIRLESGIGNVNLRQATLSPSGVIRLRAFNGSVMLQLAARGNNILDWGCPSRRRWPGQAGVVRFGLVFGLVLIQIFFVVVPRLSYEYQVVVCAWYWVLDIATRVAAPMSLSKSIEIDDPAYERNLKSLFNRGAYLRRDRIVEPQIRCVLRHHETCWRVAWDWRSTWIADQWTGYQPHIMADDVGWRISTIREPNRDAHIVRMPSRVVDELETWRYMRQGDIGAFRDPVRRQRFIKDPRLSFASFSLFPANVNERAGQQQQDEGESGIGYSRDSRDNAGPPIGRRLAILVGALVLYAITLLVGIRRLYHDGDIVRALLTWGVGAFVLGFGLCWWLLILVSATWGWWL